jgi:hypothetical protein
MAKRLGREFERFREMDRIIQVLSSGLCEASQETRNAFKLAMIEVSNIL